MIKVFTLNKNNKIELTKQELETLLNDAYWEGCCNSNIYTYKTPNVYTTPYYTITSDKITVTDAQLKKE